MANIESNTLLEKLTEINTIKNRLRRIIIDIGGSEYLNDDSPFSAFPIALLRVHSDIKNIERLLEYIDCGGDFDEIAEKEDLKYTDTIDYITDIQSEKQNLVNNLRTKGVYADISESLASLVNKVLEINSNN